MMTGEEQTRMAFDAFDAWKRLYEEVHPESLTIQELVDIYYAMSSNNGFAADAGAPLKTGVGGRTIACTATGESGVKNYQ